MMKGYQYSKAYTARNAEKRKAHAACKYAIQTGRLMRQPCEKCGAILAQAHHDDYSKPLEVRWLCRAHHIEFHCEERRKQPRSCRRGHLITGDNLAMHADRARCKACFRLRDERRKPFRKYS